MKRFSFSRRIIKHGIFLKNGKDADLKNKRALLFYILFLIDINRLVSLSMKIIMHVLLVIQSNVSYIVLEGIRM